MLTDIIVRMDSSNRAPVLSPLTQELLIKTPVPQLISH